VVTKTICIEKVIAPRALFEVLPVSNDGSLSGCVNQTIYFTNLSSANGGTALYSYLWNFGDGTTSSAFEPSHVYTSVGVYNITLQVTNSCGCVDKYGAEIKIGKEGFEIECPGVVCEGQKTEYSLPFSSDASCYAGWSIIGGHIDSNISNVVSINWDVVDSSGFGYLTFDPLNCDVPCYTPTTIKVPVIQKHGTIVGNPTLCLGEQEKYHLPQWPSTDFHWEIVGNTANNLANVFPTDQRNEVVVESLHTGTFTLRATYTNTLLGCGGIAEFTITVGSSIIEGPAEVCLGNSVTYTSDSVADWWITDSLGIQIFSQNNTNTITYTFNSQQSTGIYFVHLNSPTCGLGMKTIQVFPQPNITATITGENEICPQAPYVYTLPFAPVGSHYQWSVTNGSIIGPDNTNQIIATFDTNTTHQVSAVLVNTASGCASTSTILNIINKPILVEIGQASASICANAIETYTAVNIGATTLFTDADTLLWSILPATAGSIVSGQGTNSISVMWNNTTTPVNATLSLTVTKCTLPSVLAVKPITVVPAPEITITANPSPVCGGQNVMFTIHSNVPLNPGTEVIWTVNGVQVQPTPPATYTGLTYASTFNNFTTSNTIKTITAQVINPNGCINNSNIALYSLPVRPQPTATISIASGGNVFCLTSEIATVLTAAVPLDCTIQWYYGNMAITGETTGTLNCATYATTYGFGNYSFIATNSLGCSTRSSGINIIKNCPPIVSCTHNTEPVVINQAYLDGCNQIVLDYTATPTPLNVSWNIFGPTGLVQTTDPAYMAPLPGVYTAVLNTLYPCIEPGMVENLQTPKQIVVPYIADFNYIVNCINNTNFQIQLLDNSAILNGVTNMHYEYFVCTNSGGSTCTSLGTTPNLNFTSTGTGVLWIKLVLYGTYNGILYPACEKIMSISKNTLPAFATITKNGGQPIPCLEHPVSFSLLNPPFTDQYTYLWDFGDGASNTNRTPSRVYSIPNTYTVSVTVTNAMGCSRTYSTTVTIPPSCYQGTLTATPANAAVCQGNTVTLNYQPAIGDCPVVNYTWMNGNTPLAGAPNSPTLIVATNGFYWVKVDKGNHYYDRECYKETNQIVPLFYPLPVVALHGDHYVCDGNNIHISAATTATQLSWTLDGVAQPAFDNLGAIDLIAPLGNHTVVVTVTQNGCTTASAPYTFTVLPAPEPPQIEQEIISCEPYRVRLTAVCSTPGVYYNWSNGSTDAVIEVQDGGPYSVTVQLGSCIATTQTVVPKNPEDYIWVFASGCIKKCYTGTEQLLGPIAHLDEWIWWNDGNMVDSGQNYMLPLNIATAGTYVGSINTGFCELESPKLSISFSEEKCKDCHIERAQIKPEKQLGNCVFSGTGSFASGLGVAITATLTSMSGNVQVSPATFVIPAIGAVTVPFVFTYLNGFVGGNETFILHAIIDGVPCIVKIKVNMPMCGIELVGKNTVPQGTAETFILVPNPATDKTTLYCPVIKTAASLQLIDMHGRIILQQEMPIGSAKVELPTTQLPQGIYVLTVLQDNQPVYQTKLIKN